MTETMAMMETMVEMKETVVMEEEMNNCFGEALSGLLQNSVTLAANTLTLSLRRNAPGLTHVLEVPRILSDGSVVDRVESANTFPRATVIEALLDARDIGIDIPQPFLVKECNRLTAAKRADVRGGWSYFDGVPELPPDIDDLGTVARTLARAAGPQQSACYADAMEYCLNSFHSDGSRSTWVMDTNSPGYSRMRRYMEFIPKFEGCHPEVIANFLAAAYVCYPDHSYDDVLRSGAAWLLARQQKDGSWKSNFYGSACYSTMMVLTTLRALDQDGPAIEASSRFLESLQEEDGSWHRGDALATACAITGLAVAGKGDAAVRRGLRFLLLLQEQDALWPPGIFVRVKTPLGFHRQRSREITGAFCIKAMSASLLGGRLPWFSYE